MTQPDASRPSRQADDPVRRKLTIDSLNRGIDLLEIIAARESVRLAELPELLGASRATAFRVLKTLQERGYVEHIPERQAYRLGSGALLIATRAFPSSVVRLAEPAMADLANSTGETVNLALFRSRELIYVEIVDGRHALRMAGDVGQRVPLHATALGKAMLASLDDARARELVGSEPYQAFTKGTRTAWAELTEDLAVVRKRGYAVDCEEMDAGATCVGAAFFGADGQPVGGLSVSGWSDRLAEPSRHTVGEKLKRWCSYMTEHLRADDNAASRPLMKRRRPSQG